MAMTLLWTQIYISHSVTATKLIKGKCVPLRFTHAQPNFAMCYSNQMQRQYYESVSKNFPELFNSYNRTFSIEVSLPG